MRRERSRRLLINYKAQGLVLIFNLYPLVAVAADDFLHLGDRYFGHHIGVMGNISLGRLVAPSADSRASS